MKTAEAVNEWGYAHISSNQIFSLLAQPPRLLAFAAVACGHVHTFIILQCLEC